MHRDDVIRFRVSRQEREEITARARSCGMSVSDYLRQLAIHGKISFRDSATAYELRRIGAMLKHYYPATMNWTEEEKRRYWVTVQIILDLAKKAAQAEKEDAG